MHRPAFAFAAAVGLASLGVLPGQELRTAPGAGDGPAVRWIEQLPPEAAPERWLPVVVALPRDDGEASARQRAAELADIVAAGFVVAVPVRDAATWARCLDPLCRDLRRRFRIEQGGMHALLAGDPDCLQPFGPQRHEFQTVTFAGPIDGGQVALVQGALARRVRIAGDQPAQLVELLRALHDERQASGAAAEVAHALDDFHDAAAVGDAARYFARLPDDAVFLGTDASERWTGRQFRAFAMPYFERGSAWTYVALARHVTVAPGGDVAWFHEVLDNAGYGECRGSGVLVRHGATWVLQLYDLTIPVPNDLAGGITQRIRAFTDGGMPAVTTIVVVRHAEKVDDSRDAALSETGRARAEALAAALRDLPVAAAYASEFQRTAATLAPLCAQRTLAVTTLPAADHRGLAQRLRREHAGQTVVVCGHSNTVPALLQALGVAAPVTIGDAEFDRLFVVTLGPDGAQLLPLRY